MQALITISLIPKETTIFNVDSNSDDERLIGSLRQGCIASRASLPSFNRKGLQHPTNPPPQMVKFIQTDPNEIQLDDIPKDENMEGQTAWEEGNLEPLEVVEEQTNMAP
jgi:hypothetical protein